MTFHLHVCGRIAAVCCSRAEKRETAAAIRARGPALTLELQVDPGDRETQDVGDFKLAYICSPDLVQHHL